MPTIDRRATPIVTWCDWFCVGRADAHIGRWSVAPTRRKEYLRVWVSAGRWRIPWSWGL